MNTAYLISYDLLKPGQNYEALLNALRQAGGHQVLYSAWVLRTTWSAVQLRDLIRRYTDQDDRVLVTELKN